MAAIRSATLRVIVDMQDDTGAAPSKSLDETGLLTLIKNATPGRRLILAPDADDEVVTFTNVAGLVIISHDYAFALRLAGGEALLDNLQMFVVWAKDTTAGAHTTSVLLTGNGTNEADLEIWIIEKP
jgi:hypothetical protein